MVQNAGSVLKNRQVEGREMLEMVVFLPTFSPTFSLERVEKKRGFVKQKKQFKFLSWYVFELIM